MLHYISPSELRSVNAFSRLFDAEECFGLEAVKRIADSTELHLFRSIFQTKMEGRVRVGAGASIHRSKLRAALGALGESIERYSFSISRPAVKQASFLELKKRNLLCLDPESYAVFSEEQGALKRGEVIALKRSTRVDWTEFEDALRPGRRVLIPSQFDVPNGFKEPIYFLACTSGNACDGDASKAKVSALLELLERDAFQLYWWTKNTPPQIDLSLPCPRLKRILAPFQPELKKITLFMLKTDLAPSPVLAVYRGDPVKGEPYFAVSAACRLDPYEAIEKALHEIHHGLSCFRAGIELDPKADYRRDFEKSIWNFSDHALVYAYTPMHQAYGFFFPRSPKIVRAADMVNLDQGNADANLSLIARDFRKNKYRLFFRSGTTRDLKAAGIFAYRAFSPDLASLDSIHRYRQLGVRRYYTLPEKLRWTHKPLRFSELNPFPHPFP